MFGVRALTGLFAVMILSGSALAAPTGLASAKAAFDEARQMSERDGGRLWGQTVYGPMILVDPATRQVVANEPDGQGKFKPEDGVYTGPFPDDLAIGNTSTEWGGKRWTMLLLPLNEDTIIRRTVIGHESFHRIEPSLGITLVNAVNLHMDRLEARILLQLEWRALAVALSSRGSAQNAAIADALTFRAERRKMFASAEQERLLEQAEGLAEYTGLKLATAADDDAMRWVVIGRLTNIDTKATFARTFIFTSVPAYGLLLDERLPGWRKTLTATSDLGTLLETTLAAPGVVTAKDRAAVYGVSALRLTETERNARVETVKAHYRALLVDGPTLTLPNAGSFNISFNTNELVSLDDAGPVYPHARVTDAWGTLEVSDGVILPLDFSCVIVAAPADLKARPLVGPGWTLALAPGWSIVPGAKAGSYDLKKK